MSKAEILEELPKLKVEERAEIQARLDDLAGGGWLDSDDPLTEQQKTLIQERLNELERNPGAPIPWAEAEMRLIRSFSP